MTKARKFWIGFFLLSGAWPVALIVYWTRPKQPRVEGRA